MDKTKSGDSDGSLLMRKMIMTQTKGKHVQIELQYH